MTAIYLAGPSREIARVREAAAKLRAAGHTLTSTWHEHDVPPSDAALPVEVRAEAWRLNAWGVYGAHAVVVVACAPSGLSAGVREEMGYALGLRAYAVVRGRSLPVIVVGDPGPGLAVTACVVVETVEQAIEMLGGVK